jgi:hypothetical protein
MIRTPTVVRHRPPIIAAAAPQAAVVQDPTKPEHPN